VFGSITAPAGGDRVVATTFRDQEWTLTVHDGTTGEQVGEIPNLNAAEIGPDGTLVAANVVGDITAYDLDTLEPMGSFPGARGLVSSGGLHFSTDGRILLATSFDRSVSVYDVASRTRLGDPISMASPTAAGGGGSLRPDGMAVATGGNGIAIWDLHPKHLVTAACRFAGRNLTRTEWNAYLSSLDDYRRTCRPFS
jgi:hypothetical protein